MTPGVTDRPKEALGQSCSLACSGEGKGIWKEGPLKKGVHQKRVRASIRSPPCLPKETRISVPGSYWLHLEYLQRLIPP